MEINSYSSEKFLKDMIETLTLLSPGDLDKLQDAIEEEEEKRHEQRFIELRENAIKALRDYFQEGGTIVDNEENYSLGLDEERLSLDGKNSIYIR